jgi:hypothetical protein
LKGVVFNVLAEVVAEEHGEDAWDSVLDAAGLEGAYASVGSYPDADLVRLVAAASSILGVPPQDVVRWFGRRALPKFRDRYPGFFRHSSTRPFLKTLDDVIHAEVRKLFSGVEVPVFHFRDEGEDLVIEYASPRRLCGFAEGMIEGAAAQFDEEASIRQTSCLLRGDDRCVLVCSFRPRR